jgi:hypothetical protein
MSPAEFPENVVEKRSREQAASSSEMAMPTWFSSTQLFKVTSEELRIRTAPPLPYPLTIRRPTNDVLPPPVPSSQKTRLLLDPSRTQSMLRVEHVSVK